MLPVFLATAGNGAYSTRNYFEQPPSIAAGLHASLHGRFDQFLSQISTFPVNRTPPRKTAKNQGSAGFSGLITLPWPVPGVAPHRVPTE